MTPRVLIVDDDDQIRRSIASSLARSGFDVSTASDGAPALRICDVATPDIVVVDYNMPTGGLAVVRALKQRHGAAIFVAVLTGATSLPITYTEYLSRLWLPIALFVAGSAPYAVSRDLRYGVLPLYMSRPMVRTDYVWARYGGLAIAMFLITAGPQTLLLIGALLAKMPVGDQLTGWLGGLLASAVLAVLLAAIGLVIAAFTPRRGLGVAAIITTLLVLAGVSLALSGIAQPEPVPPGGSPKNAAVLAGVIGPFRLIDGLAHRVLGVDATIAEFAPSTAGQTALFALVYLVLVAGAGLLVLRRYRKAGRL